MHIPAHVAANAPSPANCALDELEGPLETIRGIASAMAIVIEHELGGQAPGPVLIALISAIEANCEVAEQVRKTGWSAS